MQVDSLVMEMDPGPIEKNASSLLYNDPIFWSRMDQVAPQVQVGRADSVFAGRYNLTHPASLVYPEANDLKL